MPSHNKHTSMVEKYMLKWSDTEKVYRLVKDRILHHQIGYCWGDLNRQYEPDQGLCP